MLRIFVRHPQGGPTARLMEPATPILDSGLEAAWEIFNWGNVDAHESPSESPSLAHLLVGVQHTLAALCFSHRPMCYIEPKLVGLFAHRAPPPPPPS